MIMFPGSGEQKDLGRYLAIGQVGFEMAGPIALGWLLDSYFRWSPWGVVAGAVIGFVGGMAHLIQLTSPKKKPGKDRANQSDELERGGKP
jgi:F0F1-type ATP synthase assembly protein I